MVDISQAPAQTGTDSSPRGLSKLYGLIGVATFLALLAGYFINGGQILPGTIVLVMFLTLFILEVFFISQQGLLSVAATLNAVALAVPFFRLISLHFLVLFVVFTAILFYSAYRGQREAKNMIKVRFGRMVHIISTPMMTAIVIFLSATLILSSNFSVKRERVDQVVRLATPITRHYVDNFTPDMKTTDLLIGFSLKEAEGDKRFEALTQFQKDAVIKQAVVDLETRIEESIGTQINLDAPVSQNVHNIIETRLSLLTPKAQLYWSLIAILIIWASIRSIEFVVYIPLTILSFLVYELLSALGFVAVQLESHSKEIISLK